MKRNPRWTLEMLTAGFALLSALLALLALALQPAVWPVLLALLAVCAALVAVSRYRGRRWAARRVTGPSFGNSRTQCSLAPPAPPAAPRRVL